MIAGETGIKADYSIVRILVLAQLLVSLLIAAGAGLLVDVRAAGSALLGGFICVMGTLLLAGIMFGRKNMTPGQMVLAFYLAEVAKIALTVAGFVAAFLLIDLNVAAFILSYITILSFNWLAFLVSNK